MPHDIADNVQHARRLVAVDRVAAVRGVEDLHRVGRGRHAVELDRDARLRVAPQQGAVGLQDLETGLVQAEAAAGFVVVDLIPGVGDDIERAGGGGDDEAAALYFGQAAAGGVEQAHAVDMRRDMVGEAGEMQQQRVELGARRAELEMDMRHAVDRAERIADAEAGAAFDPHPCDVAGGIADQLEA